MTTEERAEIESQISQAEQTYRETEAKISGLTGKAQDAAIRYLAGCGTHLESLRRRLG